MKQIEVINLETIIDVTAETSNVEILVQDYDSELAERFALEAQESAIDADESADIATAQASIATAQAGIATTQAGIATTQAGNALTSANNAAASAQEAQDIVDSIITADLTEATSSVLTITGGTDAVLGTGTTIQVKQAGSSQSGFLSSADWTTFNSKQNTITNPVTGTGASGQVAFWNGTSSQTGSNNLFWDNANGRLGINVLSTEEAIRVSGTGRIGNLLLRNTNTGDAGTGKVIWADGAGSGVLGLNSSTALTINTANVNRIYVQNNGNIGINTTTDAGFRLDVNGTARVQGVLTTTADAVVNGVNVGIGGGAITTNTRFGRGALNSNTTGTVNTAFGENALNLSTTAGANSAFGNRAGVSITTGSSNSLFGRAAGEVINTGIGNTFIGALSGVNITAGSGNVFLGFNSGRFITDGVTGNTTGSQSIFIGSDTRAAADNQSGQIVIGHNSIGLGTNTTVIGNSSTTFGRWFGNLLVGTSTNAGFALDVNGTARVQGELTVGNGTDSIIKANSSVISSFQTTTLQASNTNISTMLDIRPNGSSSSLTGFYLRDSSTAANGSNIVIVGRGNATLPSTGVTYLGALISGVPSANSLHLGFLVSNTSLNRFEAARIWNSGNLYIQKGGTFTDVASAILNVNSTTQGFLPPRMTTTQKNAIASPAEGLVVYDTTLNKLCVRGALTWETITSL
jgi:hypothetical protein